MSMSHGTAYNVILLTFLVNTGAQCLACGHLNGITLTYEGNDCSLIEWPAYIPEVATCADLSRNKIANVQFTQPDVSVKVMYLVQNLLTEFPLLSACAETLTWLSLGFNQISFINASRLDMLTKLNVLDLAYNDLTTIPDVSGPGNTLYLLKLDGNTEFTYTKLEILGNKLKYLYLANIPNMMINYDDLAALTSLEYLNLASQNMSSFPNLTLIGGHLRVLDISGNTFTTIPGHLLSPLTNLMELEAESGKFDNIKDLNPVVNQLEVINYSLFPHLTIYQDALYLFKNMNQTRKEIDVQGTGLTAVPHEICDYKLPSKLVLRDNSMICDCRMRWLKMAEISGSVVVYSPGICVGPTIMYGRDWRSIGIDELSCLGNIQRFKVIKMSSEFFCSGARFDESVVGETSRLKCANLCMSAGTCSIFRYTTVRLCTLLVHGTGVMISNTDNLYKFVQI